ncbi:P-loop containing nucleoside triphosphate hydrolase protein [Dipodascopsis uninucleata]
MDSAYAHKLKDAIRRECDEDVTEMQRLVTKLPPKVLARQGLAIINLRVSNVRSALGGMTVIELEPDASVSETIDFSGVRTGDIVAIERMRSGTRRSALSSTSKGKSTAKLSKSENTNAREDRVEGVVMKINSQSAAVSVDEQFAERAVGSGLQDCRVWMVKLANSITYKRMSKTIEEIENLRHASRLQDLVLGQTESCNPRIEEDNRLEHFFDEGLNKSQKKAVRIALGSELAVVHGPPGTGKTVTVVEIIRQLVARGERVLVCGPSNVSIDTIVERLDNLLPRWQVIRIGHPARVLESQVGHTVDVATKASEAGQIVRDVRAEIDGKLSTVRKTRNGRERAGIYAEVRTLRKECRVREKKAVDEVLKAGTVIASTLHGSGGWIGRGLEINTIVIDEVSQGTEAQGWIPLAMHPEAIRLILAGDDKQLGPTVKSEKNMSTLGKTMFDRVVGKYGRKLRVLLEEQYRMNEAIVAFPSKAMYGGRLVCGSKETAEQSLVDLDDVEEDEETMPGVVWVDTQGGDFPENEERDLESGVLDGLYAGLGESRYNDLEAWATVIEVRKLLERGVKPGDIGVIAPYSAQVSLLRSRLSQERGEQQDLEISTVDAFQGREKEVIVMSLVRSNDKGEVGFLGDERRLNVAMTRPKRQLRLIGDMETLARGSKFLKEWTEWISTHGDVRYADLDEVYAAIRT